MNCMYRIVKYLELCKNRVEAHLTSKRMFFVVFVSYNILSRCLSQIQVSDIWRSPDELINQ